MNVRAVTEGLSEAFFTIALTPFAFFDRHVESAQVVLEFQINRSLGRREMDLLDQELARNLVDFRDVLE